VSKASPDFLTSRIGHCVRRFLDDGSEVPI
jgi:hypothetical protein